MSARDDFEPTDDGGMTRRQQVLALRAQGLKHREIARTLGITEAASRKWGISDEAYDLYRRQSRDSKRRRKGRCKVCGKQTSYNGRKGKAVSDLCPKHANKAHLLIGTGKTQARILDFLTGHERHFTEISRTLGITDNHTSVQMHKLLRRGLIVRVRRGVYTKAVMTPHAPVMTAIRENHL